MKNNVSFSKICTKGISLVALVITIIVLIVLTATVTLVFKEGGVVDRAKEATFKSDFSNVLESFIIQKSNVKLDSAINSNIEDPDTYTQSNIKDNIIDVERYIPIIRQLENKKIDGKAYLDLIQISKGKIYQTSNIGNEQIEKWLQEVGIQKLNGEVEVINELYDENSLWSVSFDNNTKTCMIISYKGKGEQLINVKIPDTFTKDGETYKVISVGNEYRLMEYGTSFIGSITLPIYCETVGKDAFENNQRITSVQLNENLINIGSSAFRNTSITSIELNEELDNISSYAFASTNLENITIRSKVTIIDTGVFNYCNRLSNIQVDEDNQNYASIDGVLFNKDVTKLIKYPNCKTNVNYVMPSTVTNIGSFAFQNVFWIKSIELSEGIANIDTNSFISMPKLEAINVNTNNQDYVSYEGILYNKNITRLIKYPAKKINSSYIMPNTVETMDSNAIDTGTLNLRSITYSSNLTNINSGISNQNLYAINVDENNQNYASIDGVLFNKDGTTLIKYPRKKVKEIYTVPNTVKNIANRAFGNCQDINEVVLNEGLITVDQNAFNGTSLEKVTFPHSLEKIDYDAFYSNNRLKELTLPGDNLTTIQYGAFEFINSNCKVTVGSSDIEIKLRGAGFNGIIIIDQNI